MSSAVTTESAGPASPPPGERRWFSLGRLGPAVLVGWLALDLGLRLIPPEHLGVSPIVAAQRFTGRYSPFTAGVSMSAPAGSPGENAVRGNLPPTERRDTPLHFSTNAFGYRRNPEVSPSEAADVLILGGDSFIYGAGLSDEETLPAALSRTSGLSVFNGGRSHLLPMRLADLDWLLIRLPRRPRKAVFVHLEQHRRNVAAHGSARTEGVLDEARYIRRIVSGNLDVSPLGNLSRRLFRNLADDIVLPNIYQDNVEAYTLPDGQPMLFRDFELFSARNAQDETEIRSTAEYIVDWVGKLQARGLEAHVLILPSRFTVYGPWLKEDELRAGALQAAQDLGALETLLKENEVKTINALTVFQSTAAEDLRNRTLPYYREDNHWNPDGVERIARVLADSLGSREAATNAEALVIERNDALQ